MINRIGVEERNINSVYSTQSNNKDLRNPSFRSAGLLPVLMQGIQACERNPMVNVAVIDMFSAILPRTFVESLTNWFAGFEAFRRESSGLIVNCLIPSFITLGVAKIAQKFIMPNGTNMASCWADSNMLEKVSKVYESSNAKDKVHDTLKTILENIEGIEGKDEVKFKDVLNPEEIEKYSQRLKELTTKDLSNKEFKKEIEKLTDEIVGKTQVFENIKVNGGSNPVKATNVETLLSDMVKFFKEYGKTDGISISEFANKSKKLVRSKSLAGLAVVLPLAASMQYINRWITEKVSGVKGAPIYDDFGKENSNATQNNRAKEGLLKQKFISISSMIGVGLLSMMKMPSMNMLEFKGIFPTMDQARIISTTTFASRMAAADDKNELAEATVRDIATFLSLYFLGDYAAKGAATVIEKKTGVKLLNDTKPIEEDANIFKKAWHWFKDVNVKSSKEVISKIQNEYKAKNKIVDEAQLKKLTQKAELYRGACQATNLGVSLALLGLIIPFFLRKNTEKRHAEDIRLSQQVSSSNTEIADVKQSVKKS